LTLEQPGWQRPAVQMTSSVGPSSWPCLTARWARGARGGGAEPEQDPGWLHGLVHDREQFGREGVQVELVAQSNAVGLDGPGRAVLAAVEAPVALVLDAAAGRLERRGHGQGRPGHDQARLSPEELAQPRTIPT